MLYGVYFNEFIAQTKQEQTEEIQSINSDIKNTQNTKIAFYISKQDVFSSNILEECVSVHAICGEVPHSFLVDENCTFTTEEWQKVKEIDQQFKSKGMSFGFADFGAEWSVEQVEHANKQIEATVESINSLNLSPLEKLLYAYLKVTSRAYTKESEEDDEAWSRSKYGVLNSDRIVCVGYSLWLKAIVDLLGDENIKIFNNVVTTETSGHHDIVVYLKDSKYGADGYYLIDAAFDASNIANLTANLNHFLVPINDISKMKSYTFGTTTYMALDNETMSNLGEKPRKDLNAITLGVDGVIANDNLWNLAKEQDGTILSKVTVEEEVRRELKNKKIKYNSAEITHKTNMLNLAKEISSMVKKAFKKAKCLPFIEKNDLNILNKDLVRILQASNENLTHEQMKKSLIESAVIRRLLSKYINSNNNPIEFYNKLLKRAPQAIQNQYQNVDLLKNLNQLNYDLGVQPFDETEILKNYKLGLNKSINVLEEKEREKEIIQQTQNKSITNVKPVKTASLIDKSAVLYAHLLNRSKPVGIDVYREALETIYKKYFSNKTEEQIIEKVDKIINHSIDRALYCFSSDASNAFVAEAVKRNEEEINA